MASMSCAISPPAYASYDIFVHQLTGLRPASFRQTLTELPLPFASRYRYRLLTTWFSTVIFLQRTFTSLVHAHAGRTQVAAPDIFRGTCFVLDSTKPSPTTNAGEQGVICTRI